MNSSSNNSQAKNNIESNCLKKQINNPFQQSINIIKKKKVVFILNIR